MKHNFQKKIIEQLLFRFIECEVSALCIKEVYKALNKSIVIKKPEETDVARLWHSEHTVTS
jgi:hypothetical protein